jgi:thioredoxin 1
VTERLPLDEVDLVGLDEVLLAEERGVVIDFWGTWCQSCRTLRPHLEQFAGDHADQWRFVAVHADEQLDVVDRYCVMSTPTLVFVQGGDEVDRITGAATPSTIEGVLQGRC